jgi:trk system potassium uptake protein TrkA
VVSNTKNVEEVVSIFIIIAGAGLIGTQVARVLTSNNHDVVVIDIDRNTCEAVYAETGAMTVHGNATDIHVLTEAGGAKADVVICLMDSDADNIACSLLSKSLGSSRIIARLRDPPYEHAYRVAGVTTIINVADLLMTQIITEVEQPKVKKIMTLREGKAEVYAVMIPGKSRSVGKKIMEITSDPNFPKEVVFMGIFGKDENFLIPRGHYMIQGDDTVFLVSRPESINRATEIITKMK